MSIGSLLLSITSSKMHKHKRLLLKRGCSTNQSSKAPTTALATWVVKREVSSFCSLYQVSIVEWVVIALTLFATIDSSFKGEADARTLILTSPTPLTSLGSCNWYHIAAVACYINIDNPNDSR